jgi:hypothetical protein
VESGDIDPGIVNLDSNLWVVSSFSLRPLHPGERAFATQWIGSENFVLTGTCTPIPGSPSPWLQCRLRCPGSYYPEYLSRMRGSTPRQTDGVAQGPPLSQRSRFKERRCRLAECPLAQYGSVQAQALTFLLRGRRWRRLVPPKRRGVSTKLCVLTSDNLPPASAEVKKTWIYASTPPYVFMM